MLEKYILHMYNCICIILSHCVSETLSLFRPKPITLLCIVEPWCRIQQRIRWYRLLKSCRAMEASHATVHLQDTHNFCWIKRAQSLRIGLKRTTGIDSQRRLRCKARGDGNGERGVNVCPRGRNTNGDGLRYYSEWKGDKRGQGHRRLHETLMMIATVTCSSSVQQQAAVTVHLAEASIQQYGYRPYPTNLINWRVSLSDIYISIISKLLLSAGWGSRYWF